ncbi:MAG: hypothetical protein H6845_02755 [Alphaproteobacteria bacterium]|nr:MAG: hypothetical protein H6845_02755 [Alphaproteobacteria bacterium]
MYQLPMNFYLFELANNKIETLNLQQKNIVIARDGSAKMGFTLLVCVKGLTDYNLLFTSIRAIHKIALQYDIELYLNWPSKLITKPNNEIFSVINIMKSKQLDYLKIQIKQFTPLSDFIIEFCINLHHELHKLRMVTQNQIFDKINNDVLNKDQYSIKGVTFKQHAIVEQGDLVALEPDYSTQKISLNEFICHD